MAKIAGEVVASIREVFSEAKNKVVFLGLSLVLIVFYLIATGVFVFGLWEFNPTAEPLRISLILLVAILTALLITMLYRQYSALKSFEGKGGGSAAFLADYGVHIGLASILLLLFSIFVVSQNINNKICVPKGTDANNFHRR